MFRHEIYILIYIILSINSTFLLAFRNKCRIEQQGNTVFTVIPLWLSYILVKITLIGQGTIVLKGLKKRYFFLNGYTTDRQKLK